jgi:anti-anti-sigma factor
MTQLKTYRPVGHLDGFNAESHQQKLLALLADDTTSIDIDMSALDYLSSAGLQVLLETAKAARAKGGKVALISPRPSVLEVLQIVGFDKILNVRA